MEDDKNRVRLDDENETAREADEIDGQGVDYDKKYRDAYGGYNFGEERDGDHSREYHTNTSYADMSHNGEQKWHGSRTGGWIGFFKSFPYPMICLIIYLIVGFVAKAWHPAWIIFLTIPAYYSIVEYYSAYRKIRFPLFSIVVIAYLLMGFLGNLWHPGWLIFLAWPLYFVFENLMKIKNTRLIVYSFVCIAIYVVVGVTLKLWHPTWIIFLTIPIFESLYMSTKRLIHEKKDEIHEKHEQEKQERNESGRQDK